jgi:hypothetical protein
MYYFSFRSYEITTENWEAKVENGKTGPNDETLFRRLCPWYFYFYYY